MTKETDSDEDDLESARVYERYEWDCPNCNEVNDDRDLNRTGDAVKCEHCGEKVRLVS